MNRLTRWVLAVLLLVPGLSAAKEKPLDYFYVYHDKLDKQNHFVPSGWMGSYKDLHLDEGDTSGPKEGRTAIKITYSAKDEQGAGWAGIFWQNPPNNWGEMQNGGKDLTGYKRLTFWAKGTTGHERIAEFKVGGITGTYPDSDAVSVGPIDLTKDWKKYEIDLSGKDLKYISGGYCWSASKDDNPEGLVFFLDEIRFER